MLKTILFLGTVFFLLGCSTIYYMVPQKEENQDYIYVAGQTGLSESFINDDFEIAAVELYGEVTEKDIILWVTYKNYTNRELNVYPDRIKMKGISGDMIFDLKVWDAKKYIKKASLNYAIPNLAYIVSSNIDENNINYTLQNNLTNTYNAKVNSLNSILLKRTTIDSFHFIKGAVMVNKVPCKKYIITVPFENNDFVFTFEKSNY